MTQDHHPQTGQFLRPIRDAADTSRALSEALQAEADSPTPPTPSPPLVVPTIVVTPTPES